MWDFSWQVAGIVFLATFTTDFIWVRCVRATAQGKALAAASYGTILILLSGLVFFVFIADPIYIIPEAVGAFLGTYLTVKYSRRE